MYIRIKFEDIESDKTKETLGLFFSSPNGMFLTSSNSHSIGATQLFDYSVVFWYLDINILNKHHGGVMKCLNGLLKYPGVGSVDVLPIEGCYTNIDELNTILMQYVHGV